MKLKHILFLIAAVAIGVGGYFGWRELRSQWVDAGYVGILYDANSGVQPKVIKPSRVVVGWRQRLYLYPTKLQSAKYLQATDEGENKSADGILITTSDNANTMFDVTVIYRVKSEDALKVFSAYGPVDVGTIQTMHIRRAVKDAVNEIGPKFDIFQLMGSKRGEFTELCTTALRERLQPKGITIDSVLLQTAYPTAETQEKIARRINSYTEYEIALLRQQIAEVTRTTNVITAQANTVANQIKAATAKDKGLTQLKLQADEEAVEKWDGRLPSIRTAPGQTLVIDGSSLARRGVLPAPSSSRGGAVAPAADPNGDQP